MREEDNLTIGVVSLTLLAGRFFLHKSGVLGDVYFSYPDTVTLLDGTKFLLLHEPYSLRGIRLDQLVVVVDPDKNVFLDREEVIREALVSLSTHSCVPEELQYIEYRL